MLSTDATWEEKLNTELIKVWTKATGGTQWDKKNPTIKCDLFF